jgi:hypothetical protein
MDDQRVNHNVALVGASFTFLEPPSSGLEHADNLEARNEPTTSDGGTKFIGLAVPLAW